MLTELHVLIKRGFEQKYCPLSLDVKVYVNERHGLTKETLICQDLRALVPNLMLYEIVFCDGIYFKLRLISIGSQPLFLILFGNLCLLYFQERCIRYI